MAFTMFSVINCHSMLRCSVQKSLASCWVIMWSPYLHQRQSGEKHFFFFFVCLDFRLINNHFLDYAWVCCRHDLFLDRIGRCWDRSKALKNFYDVKISMILHVMSRLEYEHCKGMYLEFHVRNTLKMLSWIWQDWILQQWCCTLDLDKRHLENF